MFTIAGVPTAPWMMVHPEDAEDHELLKDIRKELGEEIVIKPNDQGSTIGITIVRDGNLDDIAKGIRLAGEYGRSIMVEQFIDGREITVGIIGDEALPVIEICPDGGFYDYERKYSKGKTQYICPAEIDEFIAEFTQTISLNAHKALGCYGISRVDFRLNDEGQALCLEVNTVPGFTETSLVPKAAKLLGYEFPELCQKLVDLALERK